MILMCVLLNCVKYESYVSRILKEGVITVNLIFMQKKCILRLVHDKFEVFIMFFIIIGSITYFLYGTESFLRS
jgi:hypothetical protein